MSNLKQEIKDLETEYRLQKKHLEADGVLDDNDMQQLNSMMAMINKVKADLKKKEAAGEQAAAENVANEKSKETLANEKQDGEKVSDQITKDEKDKDKNIPINDLENSQQEEEDGTVEHKNSSKLNQYTQQVHKLKTELQTLAQKLGI